MKKILTIALAMILILALAACSAGGSTTSSASTTAAPESAAPESAAQAGVDPTNTASQTAATAPASAVEVAAENSQTHVATGDDVYDAASAVAITLNGDSIQAGGAGVTVDGSTAAITAAGTYRLSGSLADGQIRVDTTDEEAVKLVLDGVNLRSSTSAPLYVVAAEKVILFLADGTQNTITDAGEYVYETAEADEPNAAIFSKADLSIYGGGALAVSGNYLDGISSKDGLVIAGGVISVSAADDGIRGKDYLVVQDGSLSVEAQGDGLKADNEEDAAKGYISVAAGNIHVTAGGDAVYAFTDVSITGGNFVLTSGGGSGNRADEASSAKGIKGLVSVSIDGGTFTIDAADDAIHSNGGVTINGGSFSLASADDGVHADATLTINGGDVQVTQSYEGIESAVITINNGSLRIASSDDGVNVAGGNDSSGMNAGMQPGGRAGRGGPGQDAFSASSGRLLSIHGGSVYVDANGDGLDVNGAIEMTGGTVVVNGPTQQMNAALDYDAGFMMSGGLLVAAGSSGMAMAPDQTSTQNSVLIYFTATLPAGTLVHIQNDAGEDLLTFATAKDFQSLAFSSPELAANAAYTVFTGGSADGLASDGLYAGATYTAGTQAATFTTSGVATTVGSGGRMGPRR